jgi:hypothetical protein
MCPFFTGNIIGGVDARWYGYMLADYIEQVRHGHFLVAAGQGSYAWNGSVHLFRSAPVYMAVARVWDLLTLRSLNPFALEHLTAITSAVAGTLGFYVAAVKLSPDRRWAAMGLALLYLTTPAWLSTVIHSEAYMSYMAFAATPLVLYGNARTALRDDGRGYISLGAGLALIWMCHPPIAFSTTIATLVIQSGLVAGRGVISWGNFAAGIATFAILGAYYFASMSELPQQPQMHSKAFEVAQIAGFALFFAGIGRYAVVPRAYGWAACAALGAFAVWMTSYPWLCWAAATAGIWLLCIAVLNGLSLVDFRRHAFVILFLSAVAGAAVTEAWVGRVGMNGAGIQTLAANSAHAEDLFNPLEGHENMLHQFQPGWGMVAIFAAIVLTFLGKRPLGAKVLFATAIGSVLCYLRMPLVSNFLIGRFPQDFAGMVGMPLPLRLAPVIASLTAISGVAWVATSRRADVKTLAATALVLFALAAWCGYQDVALYRHTRAVTGNPKSTSRNLRPENAMLDAYAYLLLPIPSYFSNGKTDPMLESRLLDKSGKVAVGPDDEARAMEAHGVRKVRLTTRAIDNSHTWFAVAPTIVVNPKEHLLLRFEFDTSRNYNGYLIMEAEDAYREYHLPDSGQPAAFGVGAARTSVLSLWNSGDTPEHYKMSVSKEPGNDVPYPGGLFANLYVSELDPSSLSVNLQSLDPYKARVRSAGGETLETIRAYMPGYRATVDGNSVPLFQSKQHLVALAVPPGIHEVEVRFVGSLRLWCAAVISGIGWLCFIACSVACGLRGLRSGLT